MVGLFADAADVSEHFRKAGIVARLFGGLAFEHVAPQAIVFGHPREIKDIDFVIAKPHYRSAVTVLRDQGWRVDLRSLYFSDARRLNAIGPNNIVVDVFTDPLQLNQRISLGKRLGACAVTLTLSDLLLTKLQIVKITERDLRDMIALLSSCRVGEGDDCGASISPSRIATECAKSWGLHYSAKENLGRMMSLVSTLTVSGALGLEANVRQLNTAIDLIPKPPSWHVRNAIGPRTPWYEEID